MSEKNVGNQYPVPNWDDVPKRVVSLVPSITESLFAFGFGETVVGVTDYCTRPANALTSVVRVGGPKDPKVDVIAELKPELVIGSQEENDREMIEAISHLGIPVWLVFPKTVDDSIQTLRQILGLYHTDELVEQVNGLQVAVDYARAAAESQPRLRYFCPIWYGQEKGQDWWMTFNQDTYLEDVLKLSGGENIFSGRERLYPLSADLGNEEVEPAKGRDNRYPCVSAAEIITAQPELILLPDEPYRFTESDKDLLLHALAGTPAEVNDRVLFLDGSLISWHGVRLGQALRVLPEYFS